MEFVALSQSGSGQVFGVDENGTVTQLKGIRSTTLSLKSAGGLDDYETEAKFLPSPLPQFTVSSLEVSDGDQTVLLLGNDESRNSTLGVIRLDQRIGDAGSFTVPFKQVGSHEPKILRARVSPEESGSVCVLRENGTISVYDTSNLEYPEFTYLLKRDSKAVIGIQPERDALPVDFSFSCGTGWSSFTVLVVYEDGGIFALCPIFSMKDLKDRILKSAKQSDISIVLLKSLLKEAVGRLVTKTPINIPVLQGPLNRGMESEWSESFKAGRSDRACKISCTSIGNDCVSVTTTTLHGRVYSHCLFGDILPETVDEDEALVTSKLQRVCPAAWTYSRMKLIEVIKLRGDRKKSSIDIFQNDGMPDLLYFQTSHDLFRVKLNWINGILQSEEKLEKSDIWMFEKDARLLGSLSDLDASIAVFRHAYGVTTSVFRSRCYTKSLMKPISFAEENANDQVDADSLSEEIEQLNDPEITALHNKQRQICLESPDLDEILEDLEFAPDAVEEQLSELETRLSKVRVNPVSANKIPDSRGLNNAILQDLNVIDGCLDEIKSQL